MSYRHFAYVYDRLMDDTPYPQWLKFVHSFWSEHGAPRTVVELGCGTGSLAIPLAQTGIRVTGVDLSTDMLAVARDKEESVLRRSAFAAGGSVRWLEQDMREWAAPEPADAVISFCDSMNYVTEPEGIVQVFRSTYEGLRAGGCFLFDMLTAKQFAEYAEAQPFVLNDEDIAYIWTVEYDGDERRIRHDLTVFVQDEAAETGRYLRFDEVHEQRAYPVEWIFRQLEESGFAEIRAYGDFRFVEADASTNRVFFVARKPLVASSASFPD